MLEPAEGTLRARPVQPSSVEAQARLREASSLPAEKGVVACRAKPGNCEPGANWVSQTSPLRAAAAPAPAAAKAAH